MSLGNLEAFIFPSKFFFYNNFKKVLSQMGAHDDTY